MKRTTAKDHKKEEKIEKLQICLAHLKFHHLKEQLLKIVDSYEKKESGKNGLVP